MNWYKRSYNQLINGLTFNTILSRIDSAKKRLQSIEAQEKVFIDYLKNEKREFYKKLWTNRLLALQKRFNTTSETLNKYIRMIG